MSLVTISKSYFGYHTSSPTTPLKNFPFVTRPDIKKLENAEKLLVMLGALDKSSNPRKNLSGKITDLGETMHSFPVSPRYARILSLSGRFSN